ncbi:MAG: P-loop NTPase [Deltaproteobacteria bacterium]|jgi:flagellar biosynthesis protein FlhG|nr:P-loop NTPase [Deltaproteobacteria bacterium]MBT4527968.1 P-loop NTPase [Deltaproteobacteria bacterium]
MMRNETKIIPIAGGKGGIGKSLIAANLSIALAQLGHSTIVIDLDLGGSNLHLMLGLQNENRGIGDYVHNPKLPFESLCVQTEWPHLKFIPGDGTTPFLANISYAGKQNIIKEIQNLSAEYIILDLGAGTSFNTLDFFQIVNRGILVTSGDRISLINMLSFLKNFLLRTIDRTLPRNSKARIQIQDIYSQSSNRAKVTINSVLNTIRSSDAEAANHISRLCKNIQPRIVYNMIHGLQELRLVNIINKSAKNILSINPSHMGVVFVDQAVPDSIRNSVSLLRYDEKSIAAQCIFCLAGDITQSWDEDLSEADQVYIKKTTDLFNKFTE